MHTGVSLTPPVLETLRPCQAVLCWLLSSVNKCAILIASVQATGLVSSQQLRSQASAGYLACRLGHSTAPKQAGGSCWTDALVTEIDIVLLL